MVDSLNPGPALNALVAEKIFGCTTLDLSSPDRPTCTCYLLGEGLVWHTGDSGDLKRYSEDIAAAMEVVGKVMPSYRSKVSFETYDGDIWSIKPCGTSSASLPHAICLAALKAVGVET